MILALLIVGGATSAEPAVVALERAGELVCSGSVIAPHAVLTAAHCLSDSRAVTIDGRTVIASLIAPDYDQSTLAHDVAIVIVDPPFAIAPLAIASSIAGTTMQLVGFGWTMPGDTTPFMQRTGTATIDAVEALSIRSSGPARTCEGDSGGPAMLDGAIAGVTSSGDCTTISRHARVDIEAGFILETVAATAANAAGPGDRCFYDANCANGVACVAAVDEPRRSFCAPACSGDCPGDLDCVDGLCRHPLPSPGAEGSRCEAESDCAGEVCLAEKAEDAICTRRCFSDLPGFDCPTGTRCVLADDGGEACFPIPDDGGCSVAPDPALLLCLLALAQLLRGRG